MRSSKKKHGAKLAILRKKLSCSQRSGSRFGDSTKQVEKFGNSSDHDDFNTRAVPETEFSDSDDGNDFARNVMLHGVQEMETDQQMDSNKRMNICVPIINTDQLNNYQLGTEVTFRETINNIEDKSLFQSQANDLDMNTSGRYFGSRKSRSLVPDSKKL